MKGIKMSIHANALASLAILSTASALSLEKSWQLVPISAIPALRNDPEVKALRKLSTAAREKLLFTPGSLVDRKNQYANMRLGEGSFLEFTVWSGKDGGGAIGLNRYRGDEDVQALYLFDTKFKLKEVSGLLRVSPAEAAAFYRKVTGVIPTGSVRTVVNLPRFGTSIIISLKPDDNRLLAKCTVLATNDYSCGDRLDVLKLMWTGSGFSRVPLR
ncbi:hypothetical protein LAJ19_02195 [Deinococcus taeanensis]|uniref:hypothetical protein n=1 Tax=Deinococcus taeanensis TaxID=2737050 RepID=UPI001CDB8B5D|nr:hypothetical protein [Deinococcus taeanensis]UBV43057.1 hypothetical protein LAJ19_02195 [Deinococcus taeanensis]